MPVVRLGAVEYLNARPLVSGLDASARFALRFDVPARCAALLHEGEIDLGLIPSIEYLRAPGGPGAYRIVPGVAIASRGAVASVAVFTTRPMQDVRTIAIDTSSRSSVALARVVCERAFRIRPEWHSHAPDLPAMLAGADAALVIGDNALFHGAGQIRLPGPDGPLVGVEKIDLGQVWTGLTGLPFVYAFWAGRPGAIGAADVRALQEAKAAGLGRIETIVHAYLGPAAEGQAIGVRYLRDNIKFDFGPDERAGLELFYRYAAEAGVVPPSAGLCFYDE